MSSGGQQILKRVMIIDDDPFSMMLSKLKMKKIVDEENIIEIFDTDSALGYLELQVKKEPAMIPDVILLEVMMNDAKGWDFIPRYAEFLEMNGNADIQLIILTSSQFFSDYRRASHFEMVKGYLRKPLQMDLLMDMIESPKVRKDYAEGALLQAFIV